MDDIFEKIIKREIPAHFIYEDALCIGILDKFPVYEGQSLIIPKKRTDYIFDIDDDMYHHLFGVAKKIAPVLDSVFHTVRTCLLVEGLEIAHVHIKLYPIPSEKLEIHGGKEADDEKLAKYAQLIQATHT
jgi:histidine triad (HIT) family protein